MSAQVRLFPVVFNDEGQFLTEFLWLKSDYTLMSWETNDPISAENIQTETIRFDGVLAPNQDFTDAQDVTEDIKRSLCFSVEINKHQPALGTEIGSLSRMSSHVNSMKRVYRELHDMTLTGLDELTESSLNELIERLQYIEPASQHYTDKIVDYFEETPLSELPLKLVKTRRIRSGIDFRSLCKILGLNFYALRFCKISKSLIAKKNLELSQVHTEYSWNTKDILSDSECAEITADENAKYIDAKSFEEIIYALDRVYRQSELEGLFAHPLYHDPANDNTAIIAQGLKEKSDNRERTRNIPAQQFLMLLDRATRYVVDYAEPLFALEAQTIAFMNANEEKSDTEKKIASWLRDQTQDSPHAGQKGSPFPLGGLKIGEKVSSTKIHSDVLAEEICALSETGMSDKKIGEEFNLTKAQVESIRTRATRYNRHLPDTGVSLSQALYNYLPLSCALIILSFTAGRESGVYTLKPGCVQPILSRLYINMFVPKTVRAYQDFPTVALVKKAVEVLERLSERARHTSGETDLFTFESPLAINGSAIFNFDKTINKFVDFLGMEKDEDGNHFKFSEHQFRRFFAIMYFYRYDGGDFESLAYHLRHVDWSMTSIYLSEKEAGSIFAEIQKDRIEDAAKQIADKHSDEYSGPMAEEFMDAFNDSLNIEDVSESKWASEYIEERDLVIDFIPPGLCFGNTPKYQERAKCKREDNEVIYIRTHKASLELCFPCANYLSCKSIKANHLAPRAADNIFSCESPILEAALNNMGAK
jgi:integrase